MTKGDWMLVLKSIDWTLVFGTLGLMASVIGSIIGGIRWAVSYYLRKSEELEKTKEEKLNNLIRALQNDLRKQELTTERLTMALMEMSGDWKDMVRNIANFSTAIEQLHSRIDLIEQKSDF